MSASEAERMTAKDARLRLLHALSVAISIATLGFSLWLARRGFDLTDESYYLNWLEYPSDYPVSTTAFGFVYQPWVWLVGLDIVALRWLNILATFVLVLGTGFVVLTRLSPLGRRDSLLLATGLAALTPLALRSGLTTPSYNSLVVQGTLVVVIGLAWGSRRTGEALLGGLLVGTGGTLVFLAKPPAAVAVAVVVLAHLLIRGRSVLLVVGATATSVCLLVLSAVAIDGSPWRFAERLRLGSEEAAMLEAKHDLTSVLRFDSLQPGTGGLLLFALTCAAVTAGLLAIIARGKAPLVLWLTGSALAATAASLLVLRHPRLLDPGLPRRSLMVLAVLAAALVVWALHRPGMPRRGTVAWLVLLLALPHATAFGTGNNYWVLAASMSLCWVLAALLLHADAEHRGRRTVAGLLVGAQVAAGALMVGGAFFAYRQPGPLWTHDRATLVGTSTVALSPAYAADLEQLRGLGEQAGLAPGTRVIDLSGMSPGILRILGGRPAEVAWVLGGYPGSERVETAALLRTPCGRIATAWLLLERGGPRALDATPLSAIGARLDDYQERGLTAAIPMPGYPRRGTLALLAPTRTEEAAVAACERSRA